ncbi:uncharacterized protein LOC118183875 [Stegodyphus dumicola]|uniref:uncharacterized protein LOC118183875 n=1 Tax=Stegodyphus dumicola TaxID=202533 RepID=UPI0015AB5F58|nr:uncharacterized protein LOC118183875 [Stegodyphus dumicola]
MSVGMIILRNLNLSHYAKIVKKLRKTAVPTLFSIPNPPPSVTDKRIREVRCPKPNTEVETLPASNEELLKKIEFLEQQLQEKDAKLTSFLSDEQVGTLAVQSKRNWSEKSIIKGLKMRFALGKHGYNYLRSTGYPAPSYSTLNRRIRDIKIKFRHFRKFVFFSSRQKFIHWMLLIGTAAF